ncbi:hypothetical protein GGI12_001681 [Dipsacomyces acuminosporus]|nr:hypothetical protein GGI12_001681 [Dipsacomyces acuminosporus]
MENYANKDSVNAKHDGERMQIFEFEMEDDTQVSQCGSFRRWVIRITSNAYSQLYGLASRHFAASASPLSLLCLQAVLLLSSIRVPATSASSHALLPSANLQAASCRGAGAEANTKGTAFVIYEDIYDAKEACDHLQGFNVMGRYLIVLYYQTNRRARKFNTVEEEERVEQLRRRYNSMEANGDD